MARGTQKSSVAPKEVVPKPQHSGRAAAPSAAKPTKTTMVARSKPSALNGKTEPDEKSKVSAPAPAPPPATKMNADPKPSVIPAAAQSKKRPRTSEPVISPKPLKKSKLEPTNTPPTQELDIYVFGSGGGGELGLGYTRRNGKKPMGVQRPRLNDLLDARAVGIVQIAVGGMHCVALSHNNKIYTWGVNDNGALGRDTSKGASDNSDAEDSDDDEIDLNPKESTPTAIPSDFFGKDTRFAQVVACDSASFALTVTGAVYGWGTFCGGDGIIGFTKAGVLKAEAMNGKDVQRTPILLAELKNIKQLATGGNHVLALDHKGNVFTWGCGEQNQLGRRIVHRTRANALVPSQFGLPKGKIKGIACGSYHSFAIDSGDRVYAWGLNNFGQTGIAIGAGEANAVIGTPTVVKSLQPYKIKEIKGGLQHSIACTEDHKILVWGRCDDAQAGIPTDKLPQEDLVFNSRGNPRILSKPTIIPGLSADFVAAGIDNSIALTEKGEVYSWGFSSDYRTGLGTQDSIEVPTQIQNSALVGKKLTFAGCGGQFSVLAGPASLVNGV